jgi:hypothetical protein
MMARSRNLERALVATLILHVVAMIAMAALLLPTMPGGGTVNDAERIARIAEHPWIFRLGWLPWHLTAVSDLVLAWALLRAPFVPKAPAIASLVLTVAAVIPDQLAQILWVTRGVELARTDHAAYLAFEAWAFPLTGAWAALLYTLAAIAWSWCFAAAKTWSRPLGWLSYVLWPLFLVVAVGPLLPASVRPSAELIAAGNALAFVIFMLWIVLVIEEVARRARPLATHGRWAPWRHPRRGVVGGAMGAVANSRFARAMLEWLPPLPLRSDITDVVYVNYLVPASRLEPLVPPGLELQRLGATGEWALFTFLTYRHGGFGPAFAGPLRKAFGSPVQSNWRIYVRDPVTKKEGIYFVTNAVSSVFHALGARVLAEGMPMHLFARAEISRDESGGVVMRFDGGDGSAPDVVATLKPSTSHELPAPWSECYADWRAMLAGNVPQDRAMSTQPWAERLTCQEIDLGIPLEVCERLEGEVHSAAARAIVGDASPLCFRVPRVAFRFTREDRHRYTPRDVKA